jgi:hypothetical protein
VVESSAQGIAVPANEVRADSIPGATKSVEEIPAVREVVHGGGLSFWRRGLWWAVPVLVVGGFLIYSSGGRSPPDSVKPWQGTINRTPRRRIYI